MQAKYCMCVHKVCKYAFYTMEEHNPAIKHTCFNFEEVNI